MSHLIEFFQRSYIVNLAERSDRRSEMEAELAQAGLCVDGDKIRYFRAVRPDDAGEFPSLGARGCFMSHLGILEQAIHDNLDNVLIMEDDLSLDPRLQHAEDLCRNLQDNTWHFAYFGHVADISNQATATLQLTQQPLATTHFYALQREVFQPLHQHLRACLQRPSGHPLGSPMHVDGAYSLFRQFHPEYLTLMATPSLGGQRSSRSDIFPNQWYDRSALTRPLVSFARQLKNHLFNTSGGHHVSR